MAPNILPSTQLTQRDEAKIQKFPCNSECMWTVGRKHNLTYSEAWDAIFEAEGCTVREKIHRRFTHSGIQRLGRLNEAYWRRAKDFIKAEVERQEKEMKEIQAQIEQAQKAHEQFQAWEKEFAELTDQRRALNARGEVVSDETANRIDELYELLDGCPFMRDAEGKIVHKPSAMVEDVERAKEALGA